MEKTSIAKSFGARVKELRKTQGISQEDLAHRCMLDRTYISGIERSIKNPSLNALETIAKGFGITVGELFKDL